ncbi:hypothetical protein PtrSN002B_005994 [Pyrenophora tritici-repentis]|uniref:Zf-RRN7 domain containing protein n=2 Tax=Pyrenophora tritici-repentis TaxID=45151 RepID=A0A2W1FRY6_9PLEO|nr:uncharacterized protein PTRG_05081 [Pyrenophora tritici-repentis Pt-1C-BFP]KAA8611768.1 zf-RRN7 domain-containing protein [Pyrenophora tritici-repentis]EDU47988.1 conserved hypothetical protein [Pyrenophora tritici-repentis Pt-1C-BFP]KAF7447332.1 zf-RRN7 domain containing protein [Pyrenophora tritici-repentis]KAF7569697.1 hypothetical protein PtrM4_121120 [Pyrenophora tritici-repentis]KAG9382577.1 zf-RRN7 domain containing protein [Pyrenophora tritici-repentis]
MKGPVCGIDNCRSRRYEDGGDGYRYCQQGHQQPGLMELNEDREEDDTAARELRFKKKDVDDDVTTAPKIFEGPKANELYLECVQLILRHHIRFLVKDQGFPQELETVVRDLWALGLGQVDPGEEPQEEASDTEADNEADDEDNTNEEDLTTKPKRERKSSNTPRIRHCVALCYLGFITLRLPVTPGDMYAWVTNELLPYRKAAGLLPLNMRKRLPSNYIAVLHPRPLRYNRLYQTITDLQRSYSTDYGIVWPALNVPLLLHRYLKELALPLDIYDATRRLGEMIGYDFAPDPKNRWLEIHQLPEAQLVSCILICVKMLHPLDGYERYGEADEKTAVVMDWGVWRKTMETTETTETSQEDVLQAVIGGMKNTTGAPKEGKKYPTWEYEEDLPEVTRMLYEKAARLAGVPMPELLMAVLSTEEKMDEVKEGA